MSEIMGLSENIKMETSAFEVQTSFISSQISAIDRYDLIEDLGVSTMNFDFELFTPQISSS